MIRTTKALIASLTLASLAGCAAVDLDTSALAAEADRRASANTAEALRLAAVHGVTDPTAKMWLGWQVGQCRRLGGEITLSRSNMQAICRASLEGGAARVVFDTTYAPSLQ